jgi:uncharacterized protein YuzE
VKISYDDEADALYVFLRGGITDASVARSTIVDDARVVDFAEDGTPIGIEHLGASMGVHLTDLTERLGLSAETYRHLERLEESRFRALTDA